MTDTRTVDPARRMVDVRALWTFGEAGTAILDALTMSDSVRYMVDTKSMETRITWYADAMFAVDPITLLGNLASGIDAARKYNDEGMYQRPWNHAEITHMERDGDYYATTLRIVPDNAD